jgi:predicted Zn finger-like uncharacterized protein
MKFHCDRCKTRYSIADERVRGKILKIRCKNCSAVITVREDKGEAAPPPTPAAARPKAEAARGSALRGAFEEVMARPEAQPDPSPSQSFRAPDHFEEEWYVSEDGEQSGPFSLAAAKEWVLGKSGDAELFCWQEDFDDWLPVEKVSHFRGLRGRVESAPPIRPPVRPASAPPPTPRVPAHAPAVAGRAAAGPASPDPQPLFTATMNRLEAEQRKRTEESAPPLPAVPVPSNGRSVDSGPAAKPMMADANASIFDEGYVDDEDDMDLDIGEASRVVNLAMLARPSAGGADVVNPGGSSGGLPGVATLSITGKQSRIGRGSDEQSALGMPPLSDAALADAQPPILVPAGQPKKAPLLLLLLAGGLVLAGLVGVLIYVASGSEDDGDQRLARSQVSGDEFARRNYDPFKPPTPDGEGDPDQPETNPSNTSTTKTPVKRPVTVRDKPATGVSGDDDPLGPSVPGQTGGDAVQPLRPQEVITMSSRQGLGTRRCYERALKKDPFLDVKNIKVQLTVAPSGVVTQVKLATQAASFLGQCLAATIRTWPFRKSTKGITMDVTLSFEQQG